MVPEPCKMQLLTSKNRASDLALGIPACLSLSIFICGSLRPRGGLTLGLGRVPSAQFISLSLRPRPWSLCPRPEILLCQIAGFSLVSGKPPGYPG